MSRKRYPLRVPYFAPGIRAQETRSGMVRTWWAARWLHALEGMQLGGRFTRGRLYAATGQITKMEMRGPHIDATVVGTRPEPYKVTVDFRTPEGEVRSRLIAAIRREPIFVARLLADDLPMEIEDIFRQEGFSLFLGTKLGPGKYDVTTACNCPDYANPCKHACAVLIILGEEIARRPLTLLEARGITVEDLVDED